MSEIRKELGTHCSCKVDLYPVDLSLHLDLLIWQKRSAAYGRTGGHCGHMYSLWDKIEALCLQTHSVYTKEDSIPEDRNAVSHPAYPYLLRTSCSRATGSRPQAESLRSLSCSQVSSSPTQTVGSGQQQKALRPSSPARHYVFRVPTVPISTRLLQFSEEVEETTEGTKAGRLEGS